MGIAVNTFMGVGYSFINTEKQNLSLFGVFGVDDASYYDKIDSYGSSLEIVSSYDTFRAGLNLRYGINLSRHFGLNASVMAMCGFGGVGTISTKDNDGTSKDTYSLSGGQLYIMPKIGVNWIF